MKSIKATKSKRTLSTINQNFKTVQSALSVRSTFSKNTKKSKTLKKSTGCLSKRSFGCISQGSELGTSKFYLRDQEKYKEGLKQRQLQN
jgi:hypothetical protein